MGFRNTLKRGAKATGEFAKALTSVEKVAPPLGAFFNPTAKIFTLAAKGVEFFVKNLWLLAVAFAYMLYKEKHTNK